MDKPDTDSKGREITLLSHCHFLFQFLEFLGRLRFCLSPQLQLIPSSKCAE
jgi:hypothetical protein